MELPFGILLVVIRSTELLTQNEHADADHDEDEFALIITILLAMLFSVLVSLLSDFPRKLITQLATRSAGNWLCEAYPFFSLQNVLL